MPAAIPIGIAAAGTGSSMAQGKGAKGVANKQLALQQQQLDFGKQIFNTGMQAWQPANNYWQALLSGDTTKASQAVGPYSDIIKQQGAATSGQIAGLPAGGERSAAQAQNLSDTYNQTARLYAGVQPTAAQALGTLAGLPMQSGVGIMGQGAPNISAGLKYGTHANELAQGQGAGLGDLLYGAINNKNPKVKLRPGTLAPTTMPTPPFAGGVIPGITPTPFPSGIFG